MLVVLNRYSSSRILTQLIVGSSTVFGCYGFSLLTHKQTKDPSCVSFHSNEFKLFEFCFTVAIKGETESNNALLETT